MITPRIENLFQLIEYLYSNIDNFKQYDGVISEVHLLHEQYWRLYPPNNFTEKLNLDKLQAEIKDKFEKIQENITRPIQTKANELNIYDPNDHGSLWNRHIGEITKLKDNFSENDLPEIISHKSKYIEYREKTKGETYFELGFFFNELDEILKELFGFFQETDENEFEAFETKVIQANNIPTIQQTIEIKPALKPEAVQIVFGIIKDFFSPEQQPELKRVLETGENAGEKLLFRGNGNRLTDTFKKLIEHDFIPGCQKKDLIKWIISNFTFIYRNEKRDFIYDTVEKIISRNDNPCKSPLIEIKDGQIQKVNQPRIKNTSKY